jgi:3-hydroxyacyl-[acyl-carrier-protein] dehydratase
VDSKEFILDRIPHRDPFLWVDAVTEISDNRLVAEKNISPDLDVFKGHYPHHPIMPGVLLCESIFQAGAILISEMTRKGGSGDDGTDEIPVLTRIQGAKFKREVRPGDTVTIDVKFKERISNAWFLSGKATVGGKVAVKVDFACAMASS